MLPEIAIILLMDVSESIEYVRLSRTFYIRKVNQTLGPTTYKYVTTFLQPAWVDESL